tara:strand:+ start:74 stop:289 length:216 start_codon:yes stop_codon:yes gene_type:complete
MKIIGVKKISSQIFKNKKGDLLKFVSKKSSFFKSFGEIYFNEIRNKKKKAGLNINEINVSFLQLMDQLILN